MNAPKQEQQPAQALEQHTEQHGKKQAHGKKGNKGGKKAEH